jgi:heptosyltransferase II
VTGKTIVYLPNWLGDMVMAIPFLNSLRASLDGELWAIGKSKAIHIYNGVNLFDRFIPFDSRKIIPFLDMVTLVRCSGFERSIALPHSFRSALLFYMARVKERAGYSRNRRGFMLTHHVAESDAIEPTVEHYLKIVDSLGGKRLTDTPFLTISADEEQKFDEKHIDINKPYAVLIVGAQYGPSKRWPSSHFSELADLIAKVLGIKVYILPGKGEEGLAREVYDGVTCREHVEIKPMDIRELKVCLSRASAVVSNDTGPRHIAAALSVPTIVLFGAMDERYTLYPSKCTHKISKDMSCRPCNHKQCDRDYACLKNITPREVLSKLEAILGK